MAETTTIYVTKDATSRGIRKIEAEVGADGYAYGPRAITGWGQRPYYGKSGYRLTLPEAIADAEKRRAKKIASLEKQIATMKALDLSTAVEG